jgi:putative oxidoreductase
MFQVLKRGYLVLIAIGNFLQSFLLLAIRLFWGYSFFQTGYGKLQNITPIIEYFRSLGVPWPTFSTYLSASVECFGGICLFIGLASRLVSIPLACVMIGAYLTAEFAAVKTIVEDPQNFVSRLPFNYLLTALLVFVFGPGKISIDYLLEKLFFKKN